jgi:hypothetical protein
MERWVGIVHGVRVQVGRRGGIGLSERGEGDRARKVDTISKGNMMHLGLRF